MPSAINIGKVPRKRTRIIAKRQLLSKYSFIDKQGKSPFKIELQVVSPQEQEKRRNPAYTYFSID